MGDLVSVSVPVTNTGGRPGSTVVQCYIEPPDGALRRPVRHLGGFAKVTLAAGESGTAEISLPRRAFSVWDTTGQTWIVPGGEYRIVVGQSSRDTQPAGAVSVPE